MPYLTQFHVNLVREVVKPRVSQFTMANLIRLAFHDCVGGG